MSARRETIARYRSNVAAIAARAPARKYIGLFGKKYARTQGVGENLSGKLSPVAGSITPDITGVTDSVHFFRRACANVVIHGFVIFQAIGRGVREWFALF